MADPHLSRAALLDESLEWIFEATFFARLGAAEQDALLGAMAWRRYAPNQVLVPEGVPTRGVDLIVEGRVAWSGGAPAEQALRTLGPGQLVGERSLLRGERTVATVRAVGAGARADLKPEGFARLLASVAGLRAALEALVTLRERAQELTELLLRNPILRLLGREGLERLLDASTLERASSGQRLISAGDRGRDVFLLVEGRLAVYAPSVAGGPRELLATSPGAMIGHAAAMLESPRTTDIEALEPSEFLVVPARAFMDLVLHRTPRSSVGSTSSSPRWTSAPTTPAARAAPACSSRCTAPAAA